MGVILGEYNNSDTKLRFCLNDNDISYEIYTNAGVIKRCKSNLIIDVRNRKKMLGFITKQKVLGSRIDLFNLSVIGVGVVHVCGYVTDKLKFSFLSLGTQVYQYSDAYCYICLEFPKDDNARVVGNHIFRYETEYSNNCYLRVPCEFLLNLVHHNNSNCCYYILKDILEYDYIMVQYFNGTDVVGQKYDLRFSNVVV